MKTYVNTELANKVLEYVNVSADLFNNGQISLEEMKKRVEVARPYIEGKKGAEKVVNV